MEGRILEEYLLEKYGRNISIQVSHFVYTVNQNRNVVAKDLWDNNEKLKRVMVNGLLHEGIIFIEGGELTYKFSWLDKLEGLVDIVEELSSNNHSRS